MSNKILPWLGVAAVVAASVFGLIFLVQKQSAVVGEGTPLSVPVEASDWKTGATNPKVTLVEYGDFQCPACGAYYPLVKQLEADFKDDLALVFRHYPLPQHPNAVPAAYAAEAAGKQGKFWEMLDLLYLHQNEWAEEANAEAKFVTYAGNLSINLGQFKGDYAEHAGVDEKIAADKRSGDSSQVLGTPSFYLNGKKIQNPSSYAEFKKLIEDARSAS